MWWRRTKKIVKSPPTVPVDYPTGTCVQTENGIFYIKGRSRFRVTSTRILDSWQFPFILNSSESACAKFKIAGKLGFRQGTLIKEVSDGKIYLISENLRRLVKTPDFFGIMQFPLDKVIEVSHEELTRHKEGENITWQLPPTSLQAGVWESS